MDFKKIYNKLKKGNNPGKILMGILILVVLIGEGKLVYKSVQIKNYGKNAIGKLTDYRDGGWRGDFVTYEFVVDGIKYSNDFGVKKNSDDEIKKVFGLDFNVIYSAKNPKYSTIQLKGLESLRNTIEYYNF
ncbi:hypothetical protein [Flagellimonas sp.]|uniref:hypothetical protein n=1 Tax=Flagellimonas sp. TaxID=2058762 RepID=UPI003AB4C5BE